jgi:hypothetical protein
MIDLTSSSKQGVRRLAFPVREACWAALSV